ncbi:MAG: NAD(P)-binding domain-containing protein, partial [Thermoleophilaceae bacterium]|nr:NAD(P)-binding domain-containing protein [Thermoleophilaceae bacterium]
MSANGGAPRVDGAHKQVVVVGGGQAGLSMSYYLTRDEVDHLVLEQNTVGHEWRERRWDSFCLVTPNWQCQLPGYPYAGDDPHGFMEKDEIIRYLEGYAEFVDAPLVEGVKVTALTRGERGGFELEMSDGELTADQVVV